MACDDPARVAATGLLPFMDATDAQKVRHEAMAALGRLEAKANG